MTLSEAKKQWKNDNEQLVKTVKIILAISDMGQEELGKKLGITGRTLRSRLKNPSEFRRREEQAIWYLANVYGV